MNKRISIRICIYTIILFLLFKIKYFSLKIFIFISVLGKKKKKKSSFVLLFTVLSSVLFQLKMKDKGQILAIILLVECFFLPLIVSFLLVPG